MAKKSVIKTVKDFIKAIKDDGIRIEVVFLFGSHAAHKAKEESDIDVAIVSPDFGRDFFDECVNLKRISEKIDFDISPRAYSVDEYKNARESDFLYQEIIMKGKLIKV